MNEKETNRLINMFQASLSSINASMSGLDTKLDSVVAQTGQISEIKNNVKEMNGSLRELRMWRASHEETHRLAAAQTQAFADGRASVWANFSTGQKFAGGLLALALGSAQIALLLKAFA